VSGFVDIQADFLITDKFLRCALSLFPVIIFSTNITVPCTFSQDEVQSTKRFVEKRITQKILEGAAHRNTWPTQRGLEPLDNGGYAMHNQNP